MNINMKELYSAEQKDVREENPFEDEKVAQEWIRSVEGEKHQFRDAEIYPRLRKWMDKHADGLVVDIGCGQGICSEKLGDFKGRYVGVEPSEALVERAKELYTTDQRNFVVGNAYHLPIESEKAEATFSIMVWFHLEDLDRASGELARILKPDGKFLIITSNPDALECWESFYFEYQKTGNKIVGKVKVPVNPLSKNVFYMHTLEDMLDALQEQGLEVENMERFGLMEDEKLFLLIEGRKKANKEESK
jgi:ubiquinone/menaquinone biosynthesis C-methylase UbiE